MNNFNVVFISNLRMLLIFLLLYKDGLEKCLFVFDKNIKLGSYSYFPNGYFIVGRGKSILGLLTSNIKYYFYFTYLSFKYKLKRNTVVFGADHIVGAKYFLKRYPFFVIEDGTTNYCENTYKRTLKNKIFSIPAYGLYKNVKKVYLTSRDRIPEPIKNKVEVIDINSLWQNATNERKNDILKILGISREKLSILKQKKYILFTQPLSEDGVLSESEKIEIYKSILKNYNSEDMIIKPHPREKSDYESIFNDIYVLKDNIPSEIINLYGIKFDKVITLFSTAVMDYDDNSVDFYGTEIHPKLVKHFGIIRN